MLNFYPNDYPNFWPFSGDEFPSAELYDEPALASAEMWLTRHHDFKLDLKDNLYKRRGPEVYSIEQLDDGFMVLRRDNVN